jgi:hypothetical protein
MLTGMAASNTFYAVTGILNEVFAGTNSGLILRRSTPPAP